MHEPVLRMPREKVDIRNIVVSKHVPHIALHLLNPLNGADAANAARLSTTTEQPLDAIDQGQTQGLSWVRITPWCHGHGSCGFGYGFRILNPYLNRDPFPW